MPAAVQVPVVPYYIYQTVSPASGSDGAIVMAQLEGWYRQLGESVFLRGRVNAALEALNALYREARHPNWDGEDSAPISEVSYAKACNFITLLPPEWPTPHVELDRDGAVSLEWILAPARRISISLAESPKVSFAWLNGSEASYGIDDFSTHIPAGFSVQARRIFGA